MNFTTTELITLIKLMEPEDGYNNLELMHELRCYNDYGPGKPADKISIDTLGMGIACTMDCMITLFMSMKVKKFHLYGTLRNASTRATKADDLVCSLTH